MESLGLTDILTIVTAFQLLLLGAVILTSRRTQKLSQRLLAAFLLANFFLLIQFEGLSRLLHVRIGVLPFYFLLAPLLYLYVQSLLVRSFRLLRAHLLHIVPFLILFAYLMVFTAIRAGLSDSTQYISQLKIEWTVASILLHSQVAAYLILIFRILLAYRREIRNQFAEVRHISLNWLVFILMAFALMWLTDLSSAILTWLKAGEPLISRVLTLVSIIINFVFATILVYRSMDQSWEQTGVMEAVRYSGSSLTDDESSGFADRIRMMMETEKLYLDPEISLKLLSTKTGIPPRHLSQVINTKFSRNFFDFINQYRIEEAKRLMEGTVRKELTVLEVMYNVGFNSKSSFQTAFRKFTGTTPTEFRNRSMN